MTYPDPREVAAAIGRLTGQSELAEMFLSGRMSADEVMPLLAGMLQGVITQLFGPTVGIQGVAGFDPDTRPMTGTVTLLDGSRLIVTIEATR